MEVRHELGFARIERVQLVLKHLSLLLVGHLAIGGAVSRRVVNVHYSIIEACACAPASAARAARLRRRAAAAAAAAVSEAETAVGTPERVSAPHK